MSISIRTIFRDRARMEVQALRTCNYTTVQSASDSSSPLATSSYRQASRTCFIERSVAVAIPSRAELLTQYPDQEGLGQGLLDLDFQCWNPGRRLLFSQQENITHSVHAACPWLENCARSCYGRGASNCRAFYRQQRHMRIAEQEA